MKNLVGIGKSATIPTDRYVLSSFTKNELDIIEQNMDKYINIIDSFISNGFDETLQTYNQQ